MTTPSPVDTAARVPSIPTLPPPDLEVPEEYAALADIAYDLWWCWSDIATRLFSALDAENWGRLRNPVELLMHVGPRRWRELLDDVAFRELYEALVAEAGAYRERATWFESNGHARQGPIAYFSMEFGIHESLGVYSGGLGVLAGDHCKAASDLGVPLVGVSLLYQSGYFRQTVDADGYQQHIYPDYDFLRMPIRAVAAPDGGHLTVPVHMPGRTIQVAVWTARVGRVPVLLLDTDLPVNDPADRPITGILYVRGREMRLCQELVLGFGGVRALSALGVRPALWHMNEGHVAFSSLERVRRRVETGEGLDEALARVAEDTVFTTHTPVPAGHEKFERTMIESYLEPWIQAVGCDPEDVLRLGTDNGEFNLTTLALHTSRFANGVSRLHGDVSSKMWGHLVSDRGERPIRHVTNGVHTPSWIGPEMRSLYDKTLGRDWREHLFDDEYWRRVHEIPDAKLWSARRRQKERLVRFARARLRAQGARHGLSPAELRRLDGLLDPTALTIGFARRFATYKRAVLILHDYERFRALLTDADRPVQILFAGKAHPADRDGQDLIRRLFQLTQGELRGKLVFLENYDMEMGRMLVQGCDVWLNTPRRPQEASGTSGQKAPINGGVNVSILDGWWAEGFRGDNGWAIDDGTVVADPGEQDQLDAERLYRLLEDEVIPQFFERDEQQLPRAWLQRVKASIESVVPVFSAHRMVRDYVETAYAPPGSPR